MKLMLIIISLIVLISGWITQSKIVAIIGAVIYIFILLRGLIPTIRHSKKYRDNKEVLEIKERKTFDKITSVIEGAMVIAGLIAMVSEIETLEIAGGIIWIGSIMIYFISGLVVSSITNIPLKFGYGGWYVARKKKRIK